MTGLARVLQLMTNKKAPLTGGGMGAGQIVSAL